MYGKLDRSFETDGPGPNSLDPMRMSTIGKQLLSGSRTAPSVSLGTRTIRTGDEGGSGLGPGQYTIPSPFTTGESSSMETMASLSAHISRSLSGRFE